MWSQRVRHNWATELNWCYCLLFVTQSCPTLCNTMDCNPSGSPAMGFPRQKYQSGFPFPSPGILTTQGSNPGLLYYRWILYHLSYKWSPSLLYGSIIMLFSLEEGKPLWPIGKENWVQTNALCSDSGYQETPLLSYSFFPYLILSLSGILFLGTKMTL